MSSLVTWNPDADMARILVSRDELECRVRELGAQILADYDGQQILLLGVLKGAAVFLVDLARAIDGPVEIDFMAVSSYGDSTRSSGVVRILKDLDAPIRGKHVIIVEDIVDSGLTLEYIMRALRAREPASIRVCGLLVKTRQRTSSERVDYVGFDIPDEFVVGYGLDFAQRYRNLPYIGILKPEAYERTVADQPER
jgi:hypoxanthine phosphoribosyltransferase